MWEVHIAQIYRIPLDVFHVFRARKGFRRVWFDHIGLHQAVSYVYFCLELLAFLMNQ
jgi:hypothetical protein